MGKLFISSSDKGSLTCGTAAVFPFATTDFAPETQKTAFAPPRIFIFNTPPFPLGYNIGLENSRTDNSTCCRGCTWCFNRDFRFRFRFRFRSLCDPLKKKERGGGKNSTVSSRLLSPARSFITPFLFHHGFFSLFLSPSSHPFRFSPREKYRALWMRSFKATSSFSGT